MVTVFKEIVVYMTIKENEYNILRMIIVCKKYRIHTGWLTLLEVLECSSKRLPAGDYMPMEFYKINETGRQRGGKYRVKWQEIICFIEGPVSG